MKRSDLYQGLCVMWMHVPRGGWGYVLRVPATVVRLTPTRVVIDAELARGGTKRILVHHDNLRDVPHPSTVAGCRGFAERAPRSPSSGTADGE